MVREISLVKDCSSIMKLIQYINEIKPHIIHTHSSKAGTLGRIATKISKSNAKVFYTPHGFSFLRQDISKTKQKFYFLIEKYIHHLFGGTIIACGNSELELAKTIDKNALLVVNGINPNKIFVPSENKIPENKKFTLGICGIVNESKNPKLFNEIAQNNPTIHFKWIGGGELEHLLTSQNIEITGWINNSQEVLRQLNSLDVYLHTSRWEGLPIALLEVMAMKKVVIATDVVGNKDVVIPNETGFLFENPNQVNEYIDYLKSKDKRLEMGEKASQRCLASFNSNKNFNDLYLIYQKYASKN